MTKAKTDETKNEETPQGAVEATDKTTDETTEEVVDETTNEVVDEGNAQHEKPLFTGDLGGHVLLDSTPAPE